MCNPLQKKKEVNGESDIDIVGTGHSPHLMPLLSQPKGKLKSLLFN